MNTEQKSGWADEEMADVDLGDTRLDKRLIRLCDRFSASPESPINQACEDWAETKAAYRFFQNEQVDAHAIMKAHRLKTVERMKKHTTILAIQDTSYFIYTSHPKTEGLGRMSMKKGKNVDKIFSNGLLMHACLATTTDGTPLGLLDQQIYARKLNTEEQRKLADVTPIEEKEGYRWLQSLKSIGKDSGETRVVTVCDREADIYEFFKLSEEVQSPVLVRANVDRSINKRSRYAEKGVVRLWEHMSQRPEAGTITLEINARSKTKHDQQREARTAILTITFSPFVLNPPRNNVKHRNSKLPDLPMYAVYACEKNPPEGVEPVEWMLLTNLCVTTFEEACEKVLWYRLRWRIEMYFKVLKSGFLVEACRLGSAERLIRYLTIMSIVAWRLFMITLIARAHPDSSCSELVSEQEWKVLYMKIHKTQKLPEQTPTVREVVIWIARLGGFLARKRDGMPGTITLWRGWKRLADLIEGWNLATEGATCG